MKKAFTFAELMISLVVISILAAILYPTVAHFTPNSNKPLFQASYKILTNTISSILADRDDDELPLCWNPAQQDADGDNILPDNNQCLNLNTSGFALCQAMCKRMNVLPPANNANATCTTICQNRTFQTTNGIRWQFADYIDVGNNIPDPYRTGTNITTGAFLIYADVNAKNNQEPGVRNNYPGFPNNTGVFYYTPDNANTGIYTTLPNPAGNVAAVYNVDNLKNQDSFIIAVDRTGKIVSMSPAGYANLEDTQEGNNL